MANDDKLTRASEGQSVARLGLAYFTLNLGAPMTPLHGSPGRRCTNDRQGLNSIIHAFLEKKAYFSLSRGDLAGVFMRRNHFVYERHRAPSRSTCNNLGASYFSLAASYLPLPLPHSRCRSAATYHAQLFMLPFPSFPSFLHHPQLHRTPRQSPFCPILSSPLQKEL